MTKRTICPVAKLADEYEALARRHSYLDNLFNKKTPLEDEEMEAIEDRRQAIRVQASFEKPISAKGAAFLLLQASVTRHLLEGSLYGRGDREEMLRRIDRSNDGVFRFLQSIGGDLGAQTLEYDDPEHCRPVQISKAA